ncbi:hypothetical protein AAMO2058_001010700 [Amorphochlora amoebiformis]
MTGPKALTVAVTPGAKKAIELKSKFEFKVPAPKTRKKKILDEDTYVTTMEHIIRRDYFPDLHAVEKKAELMIGTPGVTPGIGTPGVVTPSATPLSQIRGTSFEDETPITERDVDPLDKHNPNLEGPFEPGTPSTQATSSSSSSRRVTRKKRAKDLTLEQFAATHTSEDNASFQELLAKDRLKQQKKYWWLKEKDLQGAKMALVGSGDSSSTGLVKFWDYKNKNSLMYTPDGIQPKKNFKPKKKTVASNTRFSGTMEDQVIEEFLETQRPPSVGGSVSVGGTPAVRGYKLLRTPSPSPNQAGSATPIVTWGNVTGTPMHIRDEDPIQNDVDVTAHESVFRVPEMPLRERLKMQMGEKAKATRMKKKRKRAGSITPVHTPKGVVGLSPAAMRLLHRQRKKTPVRSDMQLRASYGTPKPIRRKSSTSSVQRRGVRSSRTSRSVGTPGGATPRLP